MSGATVSVNPKLADGTIVQVGGIGFDDFYANLVAFAGAEAAEAIVNGVKHRLLPASAGEQNAVQNIQAGFPGAQVQQAEKDPWGDPPVPAYQPPQNLNSQRPQQGGPPPGPAPIGSNGLPQRWVPPGVSKKTNKPYSGFWADDRPVGQRG